jgi:hypothetical protein
MSLAKKYPEQKTCFADRPKISERVAGLFGTDARQFFGEIRSKMSSDVAFESDKQCVTPGQLARINSIPSQTELRALDKLFSQIDRNFIIDLYNRHHFTSSLSEEDKALLNLFERDPRIKMIFEGSVSNADELKQKLRQVLDEKNSNCSGKNVRCNNLLINNWLSFIDNNSSVFDDSFDKKCQGLERNLLDMLCADEEQLSLYHAKVLGKLPYEVLNSSAGNPFFELANIVSENGAVSRRLELGEVVSNDAYEFLMCRELERDLLISQGEKIEGENHLFDLLDIEMMRSNPYYNLNLENEINRNFQLDQKISQLEGKADLGVGRKLNNIQQGLCHPGLEDKCNQLPIGNERNKCVIGFLAQMNDSGLNRSVPLLAYLSNCLEKKSNEPECSYAQSIYDTLINDEYKSHLVDYSSLSTTSGFVDNKVTVGGESVLGNGFNQAAARERDFASNDKVEFSIASPYRHRLENDLKEYLGQKDNPSFNFQAQHQAASNLVPKIDQTVNEMKQQVDKDKKEKEEIEKRIIQTSNITEKSRLEEHNRELERRIKKTEEMMAKLLDQRNDLNRVIEGFENRMANNNSKTSTETNAQGFNNMNQPGAFFQPRDNTYVAPVGTPHFDPNQRMNNQNSSTQSAANLNASAGADQAVNEEGGSQLGIGYLERQKMEQINHTSQKLNAIPIAQKELLEIEQEEQLSQLLEQYGLKDRSSFFIFDKSLNKLVEVTGYEVVDGKIKYQFKHDNKNLNSRLPASVNSSMADSKADSEQDKQDRSYFFNILEEIMTDLST